MAVPIVSSATGVTFGGFQRRVASFRVAGVALRDIQTCFVACRKRFCVAGAILSQYFRNTFASFSEDALLFSWQALWTSHDECIVFLRGRRSTLEESCCVAFANRIVRAASSGDNVQIPWQAWHFARCAES